MINTQEEKEETDNDYCITVEKTKLLLVDLIEVIGFDLVRLGADKGGKLNSEKWGDNYANAFFVGPPITLDKATKQNLNYRLLMPYGLGWPAHWQTGEFYMGAGIGTSVHYHGEHNFPDFLHGEYNKGTWLAQYNKRLNKALFGAFCKDEELEEKK